MTDYYAINITSFHTIFFIITDDECPMTRSRLNQTYRNSLTTVLTCGYNLKTRVTFSLMCGTTTLVPLFCPFDAMRTTCLASHVSRQWNTPDATGASVYAYTTMLCLFNVLIPHPGLLQTTLLNALQTIFLNNLSKASDNEKEQY